VNIALCPMAPLPSYWPGLSTVTVDDTGLSPHGSWCGRVDGVGQVGGFEPFGSKEGSFPGDRGPTP
jgi:hypothetical protein